jgi:hypothetical protein
LPHPPKGSICWKFSPHCGNITGGKAFKRWSLMKSDYVTRALPLEGINIVPVEPKLVLESKLLKSRVTTLYCSLLHVASSLFVFLPYSDLTKWTLTKSQIDGLLYLSLAVSAPTDTPRGVLY